jgi:hypothetical protein
MEVRRRLNPTKEYSTCSQIVVSKADYSAVFVGMLFMLAREKDYRIATNMKSFIGLDWPTQLVVNPLTSMRLSCLNQSQCRSSLNGIHVKLDAICEITGSISVRLPQFLLIPSRSPSLIRIIRNTRKLVDYGTLESPALARRGIHRRGRNSPYYQCKAGRQP